MPSTVLFISGMKAETVTVEHIPCSVLSMTFFDRLQENNIVRENGNIAKCFDDVADGFTVSDELRKVTYSFRTSG